MKILSSTFHGYLDYLTVAFFFLAPSLFTLSPASSMAAYALAGIHLVLTLITEFRLGMLDLVSVKTHGTIELIVSLVLLIGPWFMSDIFTYFDQFFFSIAGAVIFIVWVITEYSTDHNRDLHGPQEGLREPEPEEF